MIGNGQSGLIVLDCPVGLTAKEDMGLSDSWRRSSCIRIHQPLTISMDTSTAAMHVVRLAHIHTYNESLIHSQNFLEWTGVLWPKHEVIDVGRSEKLGTHGLIYWTHFPDFKSASLCPPSAAYAQKHCCQLNAESAFMYAAHTNNYMLKLCFAYCVPYH